MSKNNNARYKITPAMRETMDYWYQKSIVEDMNLYKEYLNTMEKFLKTEALIHVQNIEQMSDEERFKYYEFGDLYDHAEYDEYRIRIVNQFQNILRRSYFVNLFSFLETKLVLICKERKPKDIVLKISDTTGYNQLDKVKVYITKVLQMRFPTNTQEWQEIQNYRRLRNCIIHAQGKVEEDSERDKTLHSYIMKNAYLDIVDEEVYLLEGFCRITFEEIQRFLLMLTYSDDASLP